MEINFFGTLYATHAAYARMRAQGHGRIVVSTSAAGLHGLHGLSAYASSKAALIGLMRSLAAEGRSRDVLCNAIAPYAATKMTEKHANEQFIATMRPEYVAPLVALLVSERGPVNGQTLLAGGGRFRRAAMVEGRGVVYEDASKVTPQMLVADMPRVLSMDNPQEFADAVEPCSRTREATALQSRPYEPGECRARRIRRRPCSGRLGSPNPRAPRAWSLESCGPVPRS